MDRSFPQFTGQVVGRYAVYGEIGAGGMATVHYGRLLGPGGFSRTVAIKRLHPQYARDPEFVSMFLEEARVAARIRHPNVVSTLDVVAMHGELFLVMEYVQGEALSRLLVATHAQGRRVPVGYAVAILAGVLHGLHAAHVARNERGEPLEIVHRDVSPQNVLVGVDGVARVIDFGVAKAAGRARLTREGQIKGKIAYMSPEQLGAGAVDCRSDVYAASVVLWEVLSGRRLFDFEHEAVMHQARGDIIQPPGRHAAELPPELDAIVLRGLARDPEQRFQSAREMAIALERVLPLPTLREVGEWVELIASTSLRERAERVAEIESLSRVTPAQSVREIDAPVDAGPLDRSSDVQARSSDGPFPARSTEAVVREPPTERRASVVRPLIVTALGAAALSAAVVLLATRSTAPSTAAPTAESAAPTSAQLGAGAAVTSDGPSASAPPSSLPPVPGTSEAAPSGRGPSPPPSTNAPVPAARPSRMTPHTTDKDPRPRATAPRPGCNPPYTITADGVRAYKPECVE